MTQAEINDRKFMQRALQLASLGAGFVSPNPQVGAVIAAPDGRIIGEGWHRRYGGPHAEVNAVRSVAEADRALLPQSTIYVTLEPCSHWGKTPPCAKLLIECGFRRVVVGILDPFEAVSGRGIRMLQDAGIEVETGVMEEECREINRRFITAHTLGRPFVQLKWAQTADGIMGIAHSTQKNDTPLPPETESLTETTAKGGKQPRLHISNPISLGEMHAERSLFDAIMVGTGTVIADNPSLTVRERPGHSPRPVIFRSDRLPEDAEILRRDPIILDPALPLAENLAILYRDHKITSLMVEGGAALLTSFLADPPAPTAPTAPLTAPLTPPLYDEIRIETAPTPAAPPIETAPTPDAPTLAYTPIYAPTLPSGVQKIATHTAGASRIDTYRPSSAAPRRGPQGLR